MSQDSDFLVGGDELFHNKRFVEHYQFMKKEYIPRISRPIAFFMSCSKHKPFYTSPYRRVFNSMLEKKLSIKTLTQIYTISEPAIVVPEELDGTPIVHYDFPPSNLGEEGRQIFVNRLSKILPKLLESHRYCFYVLPKHHRKIFENTLDKIENIYKKQNKDFKKLEQKISYAPPVIYNLPKVREVIRRKIDLEEPTLNEK
ncbi:MAG: DUF5591 domain-containing protein [Asgard group archaeon]|nr:DUF5591 domain-containing protein [Asgard group archaeon]